MVMHSSSVKGAGNRADWLTVTIEPTPPEFERKNCNEVVAVNAVADITFTPFWNTSADVPFHFIAIFMLLAVLTGEK